MISSSNRLIIGMCIVVASWVLLPMQVSAQDFSSAVATNIEVYDQAIEPGDIVVDSKDGIIRTTIRYSPKMIGVAVEKPLISVHEASPSTRAIINTGEAVIKVTAKNGPINIGDYVTSSDVPGLGMKARESGYIIGIARTAFTPNGSEIVGQSNETGKVLVSLNIHFSATQVSDFGNQFVRLFQAFTTNIEDTNKFASIVRYILGSFVALVVFLFAIVLFGRSVKSGIDAIGRNPLARNSIQLGMMINFILTGIITFVGLFVAFLIIKF